MKSAILSKVAMCVCPPAIMAASVATVPPVRHAVHRLTTPYHAPAGANHAPRKAFTAAYDCAQPSLVPLNEVGPLGIGQSDLPIQRLTDAYDATSDAPTDNSAVRPANLIGGPANISPVTFPVARPIVGPSVPTLLPTARAVPPAADGVPPSENLGAGPDVSTVPEASTWIMMILGFGLTGMSIRRRRNAAFA